jgi:hypothetical protein
MKLNTKNKMPVVPAGSEDSLTIMQKRVFANWVEGFDAQGRGQPPNYSAGESFREGYAAGVAMDRLDVLPPHRI